MNHSEKTIGYYYLWHLASLGVIETRVKGKGDKRKTKIDRTLWDDLKGAPPARVCMLDVGCNFDHPNLKGRVLPEASIDLTLHPHGARYAKGGDNAPITTPHAFFTGLNTSGLSLAGLNADDEALFGDLCAELEQSSGVLRHTANAEALFSSHGTAIAGLIVGGPELLQGSAKPTRDVIPYFGVDPESTLFSIRTGFEDNPYQFIAALLYAWQQQADVIVMPRGLPDPDRAPLAPKTDFQGNLEYWKNRGAADIDARIKAMDQHISPVDPTAPQRSATDRQLWKIVRALFIAISHHIPIICAAGNDGESQLNYPASLANRENGIIPVGAVASHGMRSGYANYGDELAVVAPSDDMEIFNRHQHRGTNKEKTQVAHLITGDSTALSQRVLLTTDIPGAHGYDAGRPDPTGEGDRQGGYYTQFGGTSGACALIGGVVALIRRAERHKGGALMDGVQIKDCLKSCAAMSMTVDGKNTALTQDVMNSPDEQAQDAQYFFGAGVPNAAKAVQDILSA